MTEITSRFASITVGDFLKTATAGRRMWYIAQGKPQALQGNFLVEGNFETRIFPGLRGIRVGNAVKTAEEAISEATRVRDDLLARDDLEPFDEAELGVDDEAIDLAERFQDVGARIESILHIGGMSPDEGTEALRTFIEDLEADRPNALFDDIPWLQSFLEPSKSATAQETDAENAQTGSAEVSAGEEAREDDDEDPREDEEDERSTEELIDDFLMRAHDHGTMGFVVEVSVPLYVPHGSGGGCSVHMSTRYLQQRYASTFRVACERGLDWAEKKIEEMRAAPPKDAKKI